MKILNLNQFNEKVNRIYSSDLNDTIVHKYRPRTKNELRQLIKKRIREEGPNCNLNDIDVSNITDMSGMFYNSNFDGDISQWDVSSVTDMSNMFCKSIFNGDISQWDVSNVIDMSVMFSSSKFDGDISQWDVSSVRSMTDMFTNCRLENNPPAWY